MARYWGQQKEESLTTVGGGSENLQGVSASDRKRWDGKQDQLAYDNKPMRGSVNVLNSDAVARAFEEFKDAISTAYKQYLSTQVTSYAEMVTAVTNAKNDVDNAYVAIEKYETNMRVLYEDTLSKLTDAQNILAGATTLLNKTNTESSALSAKIKQLESMHSSIISDLGVLRNALAEVSNDADGAQVRIEELISKANGVDARVAGLVKTVEDALAEIETEKEDTLAKIRAVRDSIPEDYEKVCEDVKEVRQELIDARRRGMWITSETASGERVHATDCAPTTPLNIRLYGKTEQPSTEGNQLLDAKKIVGETINGITINNTDGDITLNGTATANVDFYITVNEKYTELRDLLNTKKGTYTLSNNIGAENWYRLTESGYEINTFTITETDTLNGLYLRIPSGATFSNKTLEIMLNAGDTALPWEPYTGGEASPNMNYPQLLNSHGESGSIVGKVLSGNLLGSYDVRESYGICCKVDNGINHLYGTAKQDTTFVWVIGGYTQTQEELTLEAGTYSIEDNYQIHSYDGSVRNTYRGTFTINEKISVTGILYEATFVQGTTYDKYIEIMFNVGDSLKEFEPYTEQPFTALTPNGLPGIPLGTTIPDVIKNSPIHMSGVYWDNATSQYYIGDTVEFESGKYVQRIFELLIDDTSGVFDYVHPLEDTNIFGVTVDGITQNAPILCNRLIDCTNWGTARNGIHTNANNRIVFRLKDELSGITSEDSSSQKVTKVNALLAEKPLVVQYYSINEPIITDLTKEELDQYNALLMNYPNTTVVNDAGAYMEVEYGKDAEAYINENYTPRSEHEALEQRVKIIEEEIIKL